MIIILSLVLGLLAYFASKQIRKYFIPLTIITSVLAILSMVVEIDVVEIVTGGFIGLAFYVIVMFAGAFPKQSNISKRFRSVRKEYSILGFILLIPHGAEYIIQFLNGSYPTEWIGIIAFVVMVPLFITSFNKIKKTMSMKNWKELQKWAYLAYALTFIHLILVSEGENQIAYIIIFSVYSFLKLWNYVLVSKKRQERVVISTVVVASIALISYFGIGSENLFSSTFTGIDYKLVELEDGAFTGSASGFENLQTDLTVTIENGEIIDITLNEIGATNPHHGTNFEDAAYQIADNIITNQSTDIDSISGATKTANSVLEAVNKALEDQVSEEE